MNYVVVEGRWVQGIEFPDALQKAKPYTRVRRGHLERVKGYVGRASAGIDVNRSELEKLFVNPLSGVVSKHVIKWYNEMKKKQKTIAKKNKNAREVLDVLTNYGKNPTVVPGLDDDDLNLIAKGGAEFSPETKIFKQMQPNECHHNASVLFVRKQSDGIVTGFALSKDGDWVNHSWGIKAGKVIETTYPNFIRYYGVMLTGAEAKSFAKANRAY